MQRGIVSSDIYKILAAPSYRFDISMFDSEGTGTISPVNAKWMYVKPVNFMIQVPNGTDSNIRPEIYLWKSQDIKDDQTKEILARIKNCANQYGYGFTINDFGSGNLPKKFSHIAMRDVEENKLNESLSGSSLRSYYSLPKARTIIVHTSKIDESDKNARTKNIKDIFIECNGERTRLKTPNVDSAKILTTHLNENGNLSDSFSTYIKNSAQDLQELEELLPTLADIKKELHKNKVQHYIKELKKMLKHTGTPKGYALAVSTAQPRVGKKYIKDFGSRLGVQSDALARQFLMNQCRNLQQYCKTIHENIHSDMPEKDIVKLAKRVCLGCLDVDNSEGASKNLDVKYTPDQNKALLFGDSIAKIINDPYIKEALVSISNKPYPTPEDENFISAVGNSIIGKFRPSFILGNSEEEEIPDIQSSEEVPELSVLREWIDKF